MRKTTWLLMFFGWLVLCLLGLTSVAGPVSAGEVATGPPGATASCWALSYYLEGQTHFSRGERGEGLAAMQKALEVDPDYVPALRELLNYGETDPKAAIQAGERLLSLLPPKEENFQQIYRAYERLIYFFSKMGDTRGREAMIRRALVSGLPDSALGYFRRALADLYWNSNNRAEALEVFDQPIASNPPGSAFALQAAMQKAFFLLKAGRWRPAYDITTEQLVGERIESGGTPQIWGVGRDLIDKMAQSMLAAEKADELVSWLQALAKKLPERSSTCLLAQLKLAEVYEKQGRWVEAAKIYETAGAGCKCAAISNVMKAAKIYLEEANMKDQAVRVCVRVLTDPQLRAWPMSLGAGADRPAIEMLEKMGEPVPSEPLGLKEKSVWFTSGNSFSDLHSVLLHSGWSLVLPTRANSFLEQMSSAEVVVPSWPGGRVPWNEAQDLINYVFCGGSLCLQGVGPDSGPDLFGARLGFSSRPCFVSDPQPATASQRTALAKAGEGLEVTPQSILIFPSPAVVLQAGDVPVLATIQHGLGRVVVSSISYGGLTIFMEHAERVREAQRRDRFRLMLFDWLRGGGESDPNLKQAFRSIHNLIAQRRYKEAVRALRSVCNDYAGTAWEEQARYLKAEILQQRLDDLTGARIEYETIFREFPSGDLALPALMGRAACLAAEKSSRDKAEEQYRQLAEMAPGTEIGAAALVHQGTLLVRNMKLEQALEAFRRAAAEAPDGAARIHALSGLAYTAEITGAREEARATYERLSRSDVPNVVTPGEFTDLWARFLLHGLSVLDEPPASVPTTIIASSWARDHLKAMAETQPQPPRAEATGGPTRLPVETPVASPAAVMNPEAAKGKTEGEIIWNDAGTVPRACAEMCPLPGEEDAARVVAAPPDSLKGECVQWLQRFLAQSALPAAVGDHLVAVTGWPKAGGRDVFVVSYLADGRFYHILDDNGAVTLLTMNVKQTDPVPPERRAAFVQGVAERLLTPGMLPHPEFHPKFPLCVPGLPGETTRGSWLVASLHIETDEQGRHSMRWPEEPSGHMVNFETDGRFVRFRLFKAYPGGSAGDPYAPRFGPVEGKNAPRQEAPVPAVKAKVSVLPGDARLEGEVN